MVTLVGVFQRGFVEHFQDRFMERITMQRKCYAIYQSVLFKMRSYTSPFFSVLLSRVGYPF